MVNPVTILQWQLDMRLNSYSSRVLMPLTTGNCSALGCVYFGWTPVYSLVPLRFLQDQLVCCDQTLVYTCSKHATVWFADFSWSDGYSIHSNSTFWLKPKCSPECCSIFMIYFCWDSSTEGYVVESFLLKCFYSEIIYNGST